ncbi:Uncharacterised protein [Pseudomonas luteola]|uniref:Uncharacterized protein n=1 Tax=Pseudomonas luteola TaxID=47886 RepID=A0A2X2CHZ5_PSELU|nr:Uncharacterised protein [Pseudomonas luteola]
MTNCCDVTPKQVPVKFICVELLRSRLFRPS